jgi:hypothetical protein
MMRFSDSAYALSSFHVAETDILLKEQASELDELSETLQTACWCDSGLPILLLGS